MSLILPFFRILGYDVFNHHDFFPEYTADVGIKKGEKVDYAIMDNGNPTVLIECKYCGEDLDKHGSQLFRYFATSTAKFAILTNGKLYRFYTDLEEVNKMDLIPFLEIDMPNLKDDLLIELKKFCKSDFDNDKIFSTAEELKYTALIKHVISNKMDNPSENFVRLLLSDIYEGVKKQRVIDKFSPIVKKSFNVLISDIVNEKITSALVGAPPKEPPQDPSVEPVNVERDNPLTKTRKIVTTQEELEAFYIIRGMLIGSISLKDMAYRDAERYFSILYKDNNRKPICRLYLNGRKKQLTIPTDNNDFTRYDLNTLNDLYQYKDELLKTALKYVAEE